MEAGEVFCGSKTKVGGSSHQPSASMVSLGISATGVGGIRARVRVYLRVLGERRAYAGEITYQKKRFSGVFSISMCPESLQLSSKIDSES